jgi:hypothetical protein
MAPRRATTKKQVQKPASKPSKSKQKSRAPISPETISDSGSEDDTSSNGDSFIAIDANDDDEEDYDE